MSKMGNTQMEIGEAFDLSQNRIAEIIGKFNTKITDILKIQISNFEITTQLIYSIKTLNDTNKNKNGDFLNYKFG